MEDYKSWVPMGALVLALLANLVYVTWKFSQLESTVTHLEEQLVDRTKDRYHRGDAQRDLRLRDERIAENSRQITRNDARFRNYPPQWLLEDIKEMKQEIRKLQENRNQ